MIGTIRVAAPAKLTLSLRVTGLRDDGLHLIEAEMVALDLHDTLLIDPLPADRVPELVVRGADGHQPAADVPLGPDNLVSRALALAGRSARIELVKRIPSQAGLGGGSSDAAAVLRWSGFDDMAAAADLGADVAFCVVGGRALVAGIGEIVEPRPFRPLALTLFTPPIGCPTGAVYRRWDELGGPRGDNGNDLEPAAIDVVPELARWRDVFGDRCGSRPRLAGSGSTWFVEGEFPHPDHRVCRAVPADWSPAPPDDARGAVSPPTPAPTVEQSSE